MRTNLLKREAEFASNWHYAQIITIIIFNYIQSEAVLRLRREVDCTKRHENTLVSALWTQRELKIHKKRVLVWKNWLGSWRRCRYTCYERRWLSKSSGYKNYRKRQRPHCLYQIKLQSIFRSEWWLLRNDWWLWLASIFHDGLIYKNGHFSSSLI